MNTLLKNFSKVLFVVLASFVQLVLLISSFYEGTTGGALVLILTFSVVVAVFATYRNRRFFFWFIVSCFISPIASLILLLVQEKGLTCSEVSEMSAIYMKQYNASPANCKHGCALDLYEKIKKNKRVYEGDFKAAELALSNPKVDSNEWIE